jgi:hypothetical protein
MRDRREFTLGEIETIRGAMRTYGHEIVDAERHIVVTNGQPLDRPRTTVGRIARAARACYETVKWPDGGVWYRFLPVGPAPIKKTFIFGSSAIQEYEKTGNYSTSPIDGCVLEREFATEGEYNAYTQALKDLDGWDECTEV